MVPFFISLLDYFIVLLSISKVGLGFSPGPVSLWERFRIQILPRCRFSFFDSHTAENDKNPYQPCQQRFISTDMLAAFSYVPVSITDAN
ncbi:MAG: hypothetical protein ACFFDQ_04275 [Candidatus Thorarchaeota archaeon]